MPPAVRRDGAPDVAWGSIRRRGGPRDHHSRGCGAARLASAARIRTTAPVGAAGRCPALADDRGDGADAAAGGPGTDRRPLRRPGASTGPLLLMSALVVANAALGGLGSYVLRRTAESVVLGARRSLSSYLLRLRIAAVDRSEPGDLMARITSDTTLLREVTTDSLVGLGTGGLTLLATVTLMGFVDPVLLGVTLGVIAVAGTVLGVIVPRINRASRRAQDAVGVMGASLERVLGALRTVKASGAEHREERALHEAAAGVVAAERARRQVVGRGGEHGRAGDADRVHHGARGGRRAGGDGRHRRRHAGGVPAVRVLSDVADPGRSSARSRSTRRAAPPSPGSRRRCGCPPNRPPGPSRCPRPGAAPRRARLRGRPLPVRRRSAVRPPRRDVRRARRGA